jgi:mono/diheme cytochrome c family protein
VDVGLSRELQLGLVLLALAARGRAAAGPPDFARDIAPILYRACSSCHRPGESGPFPLLSYADAKKRAAQIAAVTRSRYMPPWLPESGYGDFEGARRLTDQEIRTISDWVAAGAPLDGNSAIPTWSCKRPPLSECRPRVPMCIGTSC